MASLTPRLWELVAVKAAESPHEAYSYQSSIGTLPTCMTISAIQTDLISQVNARYTCLLSAAHCKDTCDSIQPLAMQAATLSKPDLGF